MRPPCFRPTQNSNATRDLLVVKRKTVCLWVRMREQMAGIHLVNWSPSQRVSRSKKMVATLKRCSAQLLYFFISVPSKDWLQIYSIHAAEMHISDTKCGASRH